MFDQPIVPDDELFERVNLGAKANEFLKSDPMGRKLMERALYEWKLAVYDFEALTPEDIMQNPAKVLALHQRMQTARNFPVWMNEAIQGGERAEEELRNRDMSEELID